MWCTNVVRFHKILIGVALLSLVAFGIINLATDSSETYNSESLNNNFTKRFNQSFNKLDNITRNTKEQLSTLQGNPDVLDIIGALITGAYGALLTLAESFNVIFDLITFGMEVLPIGDLQNQAVGTLGLVLIIVIFVGILAAALLRSERI